MPGSLLLFYLALLLIPNTSIISFVLSSQEPFSLTMQVLSLLIALIGISPAIGFLIYAFYNPYYERRATETDRGAFEYLKNIEPDVKKNAKYQQIVSCQEQKKEFLDLLVHTNAKDTLLSSETEIKEIMKGHLSNYAARIVCGFFVPICLAIVMFGVAIIGYFKPCIVTFLPNYWLLIPTLMLIGVVSARLLLGSERVVQEAFILEEFLVKSKRDVAIKLLESLSDEKMSKCEKTNHPTRKRLFKLIFKKPKKE